MGVLAAAAAAGGGGGGASSADKHAHAHASVAHAGAEAHASEALAPGGRSCGGDFNAFAFTVEGLALRRSVRASRDRTLRVSYAPREAVAAARREHAAALAQRLAVTRGHGRARVPFLQGTPVRPGVAKARFVDSASTLRAIEGEAPARLREYVQPATYDAAGSSHTDAGCVLVPGESRSRPLQVAAPRAQRNLDGVALHYTLPPSDGDGDGGHGRDGRARPASAGACASKRETAQEIGRVDPDDAHERQGAEEDAATPAGPRRPSVLSNRPSSAVRAAQRRGPSEHPVRPLSAPARRRPVSAHARAAPSFLPASKTTTTRVNANGHSRAPAMAWGGGGSVQQQSPMPAARQAERPRSAPAVRTHVPAPRLRTPAERLAQRMNSAAFVHTRRTTGRGMPGPSPPPVLLRARARAQQSRPNGAIVIHKHDWR